MSNFARGLVAIAMLGAPGCDAVQGIVGGKKEAEAAKAEAAGAKVEAAGAKVEAAGAKVEAAAAKIEANAEKIEAEAEAGAARAEAEAAKLEAAAAKLEAAAEGDAVAEGDAAAEAPAKAEAAPTLAAAGDAPCIVGTWDAVDYRAAIERAIYRDPELRRLKYASGGGTLGYIVEAATDGKGTVRQVAENVTYNFGGKVEGFEVALSIKLNGENVADYELSGADRIEIAKPNKKAMKVNAHVNVKGLAKMSKSKKVDLDFEGTFVYTCEGDALEVLAVGEKGRPLTFKRAAQG